MRVGVVGAGPAAATAAHRLAVGGCDVTLFRPARPGEKPCGGAVPSFLVDTFESLDRASIASVEPDSAVLESATGEMVTLDVGGLRIFRRRDLDPALIGVARRSGARVVESKVRALHLQQREAVVDTGDRMHAFDWLVGADGAQGPSRRALGMGPGRISLGVGASLDGVQARSLAIGFPDLGDAYLWIFPRPGGCSVGVAYSPEIVSRGAAEGVLAGFLRRHLGADADWQGPRYRYPIPVFSPATVPSVRSAVEARVLLVGDAAGVADPLTREGIRPAIRSARLAADCLLAGRPGSYPEVLEAAMGAEMQRAHKACELFFDDPIGQWMVPVSRRHAGVRRVLQDLLACHQPYLGLRRRLLSVALRVGGTATPPAEPR